MSNDPGDGPDEGQNPFKGTPFEQFFAGGMPAGMPDLSQLMGQFQSLMQPYDGPLNWNVADDLARKTVAAEPDPSPSQRQQDAVADAVRLADHWLDEATGFPSGVTSTAAWSRAEWVVETREVWKVLVEPVAERSVSGLSGALPPEMQANAGPIIGIIGKAVGAMLASQVGSGLGALAGEVLSVSDIGIPLAAPGKAALLPANVAAFAEGLDVTEDDVILYLALREAAHQRLFASVPWLREHLIGAVTDFAGGIEINAEAIQQRMEEQLRGVDPTNPESMQQLLEGGMFDLPESPAQRAALERLEIALALVEGWVDEVVGQATAERMPAAAKLQEAVRRRRAAGGPAEQTFAALVGLELRPRRLRDASTLWGSLRTRQGTEARDGVWMHPDLLPTSADLDDPLGFREDAAAPAELTEDDFDAELRKLLDNELSLHADAVRVLRDWVPPSPSQATARDRYVAHLIAHRDGLSRECRPDHITASAVVLSHDRSQVLLTLHAKAQRWFQFGGHCEPEDSTLAAAALREATEESGVSGLQLNPTPVQLNEHVVPFCGANGDTHHLDVRFVAVAPEDAEHTVSDESLDVRWWPADGLPEPELVELVRLALASH